MKKIIKVVIIYIGLIFISTKVFATTGTTENDTTRLREKASTDSSTVTLISGDEEVEILSEEGDWYKVTYKNDGKTYSGYIRKDMLNVNGEVASSKEDENTTNNEATTENESTSQETENVNEGEATTSEETENVTESESISEESENSQTVNIEIEEGKTVSISSEVELRILPLINSSKSAKIAKNTNITINEIVGKWCNVETDQQSGWVMKSNLENILQNETETKVEEENKTEKEETTSSKDESEDDSKKQEEKTLYVSSDTVNLREKANTNSTILKQLSINTKVTVKEKVDDTWSKVEINGVTGYIATSYLSEKQTEVTSRGSTTSRTENATESKEEKTEEKKEETTTSTNTTSTSNSSSSSSSSSSSNSNSNSSSSTSSTTTSSSTKTETTTSSKTESSNTTEQTTSTVTGADIVAYAKKYKGYKYVSGGTSPKTGFDCSGLVYYVYGHFGYSLSRTSSAQASNGTKVKKSELKAGDLIIFNNSANTSIGHVGIYIGGNEFIHAANPSKGVIITSLSDSYYSKRYVTARRIIN